MSWVKKGNVVAAAAGFALVGLLSTLFLDGIIRWALVSAGQAAAGAKVEIGSVSTRLFKGRASIRRVRVADKDEPMKNVVELESVELSLKPSALLRGKVVIREASAAGLRFGTARKTSGALSPKPPSAIETAVRRELAPSAQAALGEAKAGVKTEIDAAKLQSVKALDEARARVEAVPERFKAKAAEAKRVEAEVREVTKTLSSLKGGSPADVARQVETVGQAQRKLKALLDDVQRSKGELTQELDAVRGQLRKAEDLKGKDLSGLMAAAGLPSLDAAELSRRLLGPALMKKVSTGMRWLSWARKHRSSKPAGAEEKRQRRRGVNVEFPSKDRDPSFLLENARLQGYLAREGGELALEGSLGGVTTNPPAYGKPARLQLSGGAAGGPSLKVDGTLDQTREPGSGGLDFAYAGVPLTGLELGDAELGAKLGAGTARVSGLVKLSGDEWNGEIRVQAEGVSLEPKLGLSGDMGRFADAALKGVKGFGATISVSGREDDLHFGVRSDLGASLAEGLKRGATAAFASQRKALEDKLNALYSARAAEVRSRLDGVQASLLSPLQQQESSIQNALKDAASKALGPKLDLKKLFH